MAKWMLAKIDQTQNWTDCPESRFAGCIFGVFVFDRDKHVHCCEFTPSYELHWVEDQFDGTPEFFALPEEEKERINDWVMEAARDTPLVCYYHTHVIDGLDISDGSKPFPVGNGSIMDLELPEETTEDEAIQSVCERAW